MEFLKNARNALKINKPINGFYDNVLEADELVKKITNQFK